MTGTVSLRPGEFSGASGSLHASDTGNFMTRRPLLVVAGLTRKNLEPRVWDPASPYYLPQLRAVMISYADFHRTPRWRAAAMTVGLRAFLEIPPDVLIYLDNGAFSLLNGGSPTSTSDYEAFVEQARPDWYPIPVDYIPTPAMDAHTQRLYFEQTMTMNRAYAHDGYVPVAHVGPHLEQFVQSLTAEPALAATCSVALGGIVPNLLRRSQARPYAEVLAALRQMRARFGERTVHVFGMGGTATLHLAALLGIDSVDSSGWRNRAARGLIQLPGTGDRIVTQLGSWRGRFLSPAEVAILDACACPPCQRFGGESIRARGLPGASHRATHNLWVLLQEAALIERHLRAGSYQSWYRGHLDNTIYAPLIEHVVQQTEG